MKKISTLRNKSDKLMQEYYRKQSLFCEGCGKPAVCMHHFFTKSTSSALRYYEPNLIAVCAGCHLAHHNGDPRLHAAVMQKRQLGWYSSLLIEKQRIIRINKGYYQKIIEKYDNNKTT